MASNRLQSMLLTVFAGIAVLLAAIGIYGVISYSVEQRTHEIGIRAALGASKGDLLRLILRSGMLMAGIGLAVGFGGVFGLTRSVGEPALRRGRARPDDDRRSRVPAGVRRAAGVLHSGEAGDESGSDDCASIRVSQEEEGRSQKAEGRSQKAEGRSQEAEARMAAAYALSRRLTSSAVAARVDASPYPRSCARIR